MPDLTVSINPDKPTSEQDPPIHNRWHPEIPAIGSVKPGDTVRLECWDCTGGQIENSDTADDVLGLEFGSIHPLTGPIAVSGAEPGDLLVVDILDVGPLPGWDWGYSMVFPGHLRTGLLHDVFPEAAKAIWDVHGIYGTSRHIPGVRFAGTPHPGLMGCAPDGALLDRWNRRESEIVTNDPHRETGLPPEPAGALLGALQGSEFGRAAKEAARTIAHRENGGNGDIRSLSLGARVYYPVYLKGANLSVGDIHFSLGDGEITTPVEVFGQVELGIDLIKGGMQTYGITHSMFQPARVEPKYSEYLVFEGLSVDDEDRQYYLDASMSFRRACLNAIDYLKKFGYTGEQAYMILASVPIESRVACMCNVPNACCTVGLPTQVFDFDIRPSSEGPVYVSRGMPALVGDSMADQQT